MNNHPIGIFDSGIGGLTVASAITHMLPNEQLIYFGDTAHLPYGDKEPYSIKHYATEIAKFLLEKNCKVIVIACHTASSLAYEEVKQIVGEKAIVINVIDPIIDYVLKDSNRLNGLGIIGTKGTILSNVYSRKIQEKSDEIEVKQLATPLLCPMIEEGFINDKISNTIIENYLNDETLNEIDSLILACTHYPLIKKQIKAFYGNTVTVIDSAEVVAQHLKTLLESKQLASKQRKEPHHFYVSDLTDSFEKSTRYFFKESIHLEKGSIWS